MNELHQLIADLKHIKVASATEQKRGRDSGVIGGFEDWDKPLYTFSPALSAEIVSFAKRACPVIEKIRDDQKQNNDGDRIVDAHMLKMLNNIANGSEPPSPISWVVIGPELENKISRHILFNDPTLKHKLAARVMSGSEVPYLGDWQVSVFDVPHTAFHDEGVAELVTEVVSSGKAEIWDMGHTYVYYDPEFSERPIFLSMLRYNSELGLYEEKVSRTTATNWADEE